MVFYELKVNKKVKQSILCPVIIKPMEVFLLRLFLISHCMTITTVESSHTMIGLRCFIAKGLNT